MKIKVKLKKEKYLVLINGYPIDSFDIRYEAIACKEQLEILGDEMIKEILESRNRELTTLCLCKLVTYILMMGNQHRTNQGGQYYD